MMEYHRIAAAAADEEDKLQQQQQRVELLSAENKLQQEVEEDLSLNSAFCCRQG